VELASPSAAGLSPASYVQLFPAHLEFGQVRFLSSHQLFKNA
jgi:hypothetical protein